ncbi:Sec-independent protein translocase protein TATB, chloroplastic [Sesamum alatum]|uniref:Sec-independent protein translocase protein TATB, chloroplastic n=1 Tax=Sesamum alatum TaxID=300844 RepID=A0AAE1YK10_9LAMI|nr:Sec-independent protein translocase protein TATB, chloroplastic [Sesamum alatum]
MAFAISTPTSSLLHSSSSSPAGVKILALCSFSNSAVSIPRNAVFQHVKCIPQLGITPFSQWSGLKHVGISISQYSVKMERKGKCKGKGVYASLFGVGAPEFLVIGVVALLVFGPKGLAEVARNLGKTLRAFQPTIRELQEVSREFKSTLEREIGLDDIDTPVPKGSSSNTTKPTSEDTQGDSETNVEPNGSPSENAEDDEALQFADRFRGTLAQLQKEQEEERQKEEREKAQSLAESETPSQGTPQALDTAQEASPVTPVSENPDNNALQEAASVAPASPAPKAEAEV